MVLQEFSSHRVATGDGRCNAVKEISYRKVQTIVNSFLHCLTQIDRYRSKWLVNLQGQPEGCIAVAFRQRIKMPTNNRALAQFAGSLFELLFRDLLDVYLIWPVGYAQHACVGPGFGQRRRS